MRVDRFFVHHLLPQIGKVTYVESMNATLLIESSKIEIRAYKEAAKKLKTRGSFSSSFSFGGGYGP